MSTKKRIIRTVFIFILGVILGGVSRLIIAYFDQFSWPSFLNIELLKNIGRASLLILFPLFFFLLYQANRYYVAYEKEEDEERSYELYRLTFRSLEYATVLYNIANAMTFFTLFVGVTYIVPFLKSGAAFNLPFYDIVLFPLLIIGQVLVLKTTKKIRQYKLSAMPTIEEIKEYALSYDEGELQANYEQSFFILFNLNQRIIPGLYLLLFFVGTGTQINVTSGIVVLTIIFVYINAMSYQMIKKYFK